MDEEVVGIGGVVENDLNILGIGSTTQASEQHKSNAREGDHQNAIEHSDGREDEHKVEPEPVDDKHFLVENVLRQHAQVIESSLQWLALSNGPNSRWKLTFEHRPKVQTS